MTRDAWYRQPMLALVIGLPLAAVVAGIATLVLAVRGSGDAGDPRVRRVAQTQTADIAPDRAAARLGLTAAALLFADGRVVVRFAAAAPDEGSLRLALRHAVDPRQDRVVNLSPAAGDAAYGGRLPAPRAAGAYNVELAPWDATWRLVGRLESDDSRVRLEAALED